MKLQQMLSLVRQAVDDYNMIEDGDCIAVGVSGGKDSLAMLYALHHLQQFYPRQFTLHAVTVDLGFDTPGLEKIVSLCENLNIKYTIARTQIAQIVFEEKKEHNPCSLCARMRKGALNDTMKELGCNKVAYAHHKDDVVETMLMSLIYEGRIHTFSPTTCLERTGLTLIRPMIYMEEADIKGFINKYNVPVVKTPCPMDGNTRREYIKNLLKQLNKENPGIKKRIFTAIKNSNMKGWQINNGSH